MKPALDRVLRELTTQGQRLGGFITYQSVIDLLQGSSLGVSVEALDSVYDYLAAHQVQIVDRLPVASAIGPRSPSRRLRLVQDADADGPQSLPDPGSEDTLPCPEQALDYLISRADDSGSLQLEHSAAVIAALKLSTRDLTQLVEYLGSIGLDIAGTGLPRTIPSVSSGGGRDGYPERADFAEMSSCLKWQGQIWYQGRRLLFLRSFFTG